MAGLVVGADLLVMSAGVPKLAELLAKNYRLARDIERGIRFLKDELSSMDAVLQKLAGKEDDQIDPQAREWRNKVRELSNDIEVCIDRFMLNHNHGGFNANFVYKAVQKVKNLQANSRISMEIEELKSLVIEQSKRTNRYGIHLCLAASHQTPRLNPRASLLLDEAGDLVGIDGPREEIFQLLKAEEKQHKVVSIYGAAGQGKTTLAMEVYRKINGFDCWAFVSVSQTPDTKKLLRELSSQISQSIFEQSERLETEQLISTMREYLTDKRYFILIDNIWDVSTWELVQCALPPNDYGSRIITTTLSKTVAKTCCAGIEAHMYEARPLSNEDSQRLFFKRLFCSSEDFPQDLMELSSDILSICGGLPLAIISIAGLLANRIKTKEVWVNTLKSISAAVDKNSPVDKMKGILLLSYFDLPHHLKSCLLYLSVFPEDYLIECRKLTLLWVAEGLIPGQDRESMEQLGRSFLNELIYRSFVKPIKVGIDGETVEWCRVHDVIHEFIVSKALEDNFVTIWNRNGISKNYNSNKIRRLSIQVDISAQVGEIDKIRKKEAHIRSINIFGSNSVLVNYTSVFLRRQVLRVLNIDGVVTECYLKHTKSFGQMKYFWIAPGSESYKLTSMLGKRYRLARVDEHEIRFLKDELSSMYPMLEKLTEKDYDEINPQAREWRNKVRELSYDIEDCINCAVLNIRGSKDVAAGPVTNFVRKVKMLRQDYRLEEEMKKLKTLVREQSDRAIRYGIYQSLAASCHKVLNDTESMDEFTEAGMGTLLQAEKLSHGVQQGTLTISGMGSSEIIELNILERIVDGSEEPSHLDFPLLQSITNYFSEKQRIGLGGCAEVYKGILRNGVVAVKRLFKARTIDEKMFHREVKTLMAVSHQNIVRFLGYCSVTEERVLPLGGQPIMVDIRERLLCFEYINRGSLESHLTDELRGLEWQTRYEIILGICNGLLYLHKEKNIIHMDLKPANILLDDHLVPKIADFGLSRLDKNSQTTTTSRLVTPVYSAPEYCREGKSSSKSDIYSLGVIIVVVVTGSNRKMPNITEVLRRWRHRWIKSSNHTPCSYQQVTKCLELAQKCAQEDPTCRPDIIDIIDEFSRIMGSMEDQFQISEHTGCGMASLSPLSQVIVSLEDMLGIEPLQIDFLFEEHDQQIIHTIDLSNDTDDHFAFNTNPSLRCLRTEPDKGIVPPRSKCSITVTVMQAQVNARLINHCKDKITVLSTRVEGGLATKDITEDMFIDEEGKVVDEVNVTVVLGKPQLADES